MVALFNNDSTACRFRVTHMHFEIFQADFHISDFSFILTREYNFCFLYNCLSKLDTHAVSEDKNKNKNKNKTKKIDCSLIPIRYQVNRNVLR